MPEKTKDILFNVGLVTVFIVLYVVYDAKGFDAVITPIANFGHRLASLFH